MLCSLMRNKLLNLDAELEEDRLKGMEMTEKFTSQVFMENGLVRRIAANC